MTEYCACGDVAIMFTTADGDPLPKPLCSDCWFFELTMHEQHLPEHEFEQPEQDELKDLIETYDLVEKS